MPLSIQVRGAFQLSRTARKIREAGRKDLPRQMTKALTRTVKPLTVAVKASLPGYMPDRYAAVLGKDLRLRTKIQTRGDGAGLRITGHAPTRSDERDVKALESGILRHPLYGNRGWWYAQRITPGFFSEPISEGAPVVRAELNRVIAEFLQKITKG
jgi:hypothetical protein